MDLSGFTAAIDGLKAIKDLIKKAIEMKTDNAVAEKATEIYEHLISVQEQLLMLQSEHSAMSRLKDDLERQVVELVQWGEDKTRYELHRLASGSLVYRIKPDCQGAEPTHYLCPNCYSKNIKSVLQFGGYKDSHSTLQCLNPDCGAVVLDERQEQRAYSVPRSDRGAW